MTRQEANMKIVSFLWERYDNDTVSFMRACVETYPQQRFGQIVCNYVCPDYREDQPCITTLYIMDDLFPGNPDPFFEESTETLERLKQSKRL